MSAKVSTSINDTEGREILSKRGLRQENQLTPTLFTIVACGLDIMIIM